MPGTGHATADLPMAMAAVYQQAARSRCAFNQAEPDPNPPFIVPDKRWFNLEACTVQSSAGASDVRIFRAPALRVESGARFSSTRCAARRAGTCAARCANYEQKMISLRYA